MMQASSAPNHPTSVIAVCEPVVFGTSVAQTPPTVNDNQQQQQQKDAPLNSDGIVLEHSPVAAYSHLPSYIRGRHFAHSTTLACGNHSLYLLYGPAGGGDAAAAATAATNNGGDRAAAASASAVSSANISPLGLHNARKKAAEQEQRDRLAEKQQQLRLQKESKGTLLMTSSSGGGSGTAAAAAASSSSSALKEAAMVQYAHGDRAWNIMLSNDKFASVLDARYATPEDNEMGRFAEGYFKVHRAKPSMQQLRSVVPVLDEGHETTKRATQRLQDRSALLSEGERLVQQQQQQQQAGSPTAKRTDEDDEDSNDDDDGNDSDEKRAAKAAAELLEKQKQQHLRLYTGGAGTGSSPNTFWRKSGSNSPIFFSSPTRGAGGASSSGSGGADDHSSSSSLSIEKPIPFLCRYQSRSGLRVRTRCDALISMTNTDQREDCFANLRREVLAAALDGRDAEIRIRRVNAEGYAVPYWLRGCSGSFADETAFLQEQARLAALAESGASAVDPQQQQQQQRDLDDAASVATAAPGGRRSSFGVRRRSSFTGPVPTADNDNSNNPAARTQRSNSVGSVASTIASLRQQHGKRHAHFKSFVERVFEDIKTALESRNVIVGEEKQQREKKAASRAAGSSPAAPVQLNSSSGSAPAAIRSRGTAAAAAARSGTATPAGSGGGARRSPGRGSDSDTESAAAASAGPTEIFVTRLGIAIAAVTATPSAAIKVPEPPARFGVAKQQPSADGQQQQQQQRSCSDRPQDLAVVDLLANTHEDDPAARAALFGDKAVVRLPSDPDRQLPGARPATNVAAMLLQQQQQAQQQQRKRGSSMLSNKSATDHDDVSSNTSHAHSTNAPGGAAGTSGSRGGNSRQQSSAGPTSSRSSSTAAANSGAASRRHGAATPPQSSSSTAQRKIYDTLHSNANYRAACTDDIDSKCVVVENVESLGAVLSSAGIRCIYEAATRRTTSFVITLFATQKCAISASKFSRVRIVFEPSDLCLEDEEHAAAAAAAAAAAGAGTAPPSTTPSPLKSANSNGAKNAANRAGTEEEGGGDNNNEEDDDGSNLSPLEPPPTTNLVVASETQVRRQKQMQRLAARAGNPPLRCYPAPITHTCTFVASCSLLDKDPAHFVAATDALFNCLARVHSPICTVVTDCINPHFDVIDCTNELEAEFAKRRGISRHHQDLLASVKRQLVDFAAKRAELEAAVRQLQAKKFELPDLDHQQHQLELVKQEQALRNRMLRRQKRRQSQKQHQQQQNRSDRASSSSSTSSLDTDDARSSARTADEGETATTATSSGRGSSSSALAIETSGNGIASKQQQQQQQPAVSSPLSPLMRLQLQLQQLNSSSSSLQSPTSPASLRPGGSKTVTWMVDAQNAPDAVFERRFKQHQRTRTARRSELLRQYDAAVEARVRATERLFRAQREVKALKSQAQHGRVEHELRLQQTAQRNEQEARATEAAMIELNEQVVARECGGKRGLLKAEALLEKQEQERKQLKSVASLYINNSNNNNNRSNTTNSNVAADPSTGAASGGAARAATPKLVHSFANRKWPGSGVSTPSPALLRAAVLDASGGGRRAGGGDGGGLPPHQHNGRAFIAEPGSFRFSMSGDEYVSERSHGNSNNNNNPASHPRKDRRGNNNNNHDDDDDDDAAAAAGQPPQDAFIDELGEYRPGGVQRFFSNVRRAKAASRLESFVAFPSLSDQRAGSQLRRKRSGAAVVEGESSDADDDKVAFSPTSKRGSSKKTQRPESATSKKSTGSKRATIDEGFGPLVKPSTQRGAGSGKDDGGGDGDGDGDGVRSSASGEDDDGEEADCLNDEHGFVSLLVKSSDGDGDGDGVHSSASGEDDDGEEEDGMNDELGIWSPLVKTSDRDISGAGGGGASAVAALPEEAKRLIQAVNPSQRLEPPKPKQRGARSSRNRPASPPSSPNRGGGASLAGIASGGINVSNSSSSAAAAAAARQVDQNYRDNNVLGLPRRAAPLVQRDTLLQFGMLLAHCERFLRDHMPVGQSSVLLGGGSGAGGVDDDDPSAAATRVHQKPAKFARVKTEAPMFNRRYSGDPVMEAQLSRLARVAESSGCRFFLNAKAQMERDYVLLIDRSRSMLQGRRWRDAEDAVKVLAPHICKFDPDGITLIFFDHEVVKFDNVMDAKQVSQLFRAHPPRGSTRLDLALHVALQDHFEGERGATTILCCTDGAPDNKEKVKEVICQATYAMGGPSEVSISIIQIGNVESASAYLKELDDELVDAAFDIVDTLTSQDCKSMSFNELVAKSLFD